MLALTANGLPQLPRTTEAATIRYMKCYKQNFKGEKTEMKRLASMAEAKILSLRRKAPKFHETKLPTLINQAATLLLTCETTTPSGEDSFHRVHRFFLKILDELMETQPAGDVDYHKERGRIEEKEKLQLKFDEIDAKIDLLNAKEFDADDIGEDEMDNDYTKTFNELESLRAEQNRVATLLEILDGEKPEPTVDFKIEAHPPSVLSRLTNSQIDQLEVQIIDFLKIALQKKHGVLLGIPDVEPMIASLCLDPETFSKEMLDELSKDTVDCVVKYHRNLENKKRNEYFNSLINNPRLKPKEGLILRDPDDVPEEVKRKLDYSIQQRKRKLDQYCEEFANRPVDEDACPSDDLENNDDTDSDDVREIREYITKNQLNFKRIKEESHDEYPEDTPSPSASCSEEDNILDNLSENEEEAYNGGKEGSKQLPLMIESQWEQHVEPRMKQEGQKVEPENDDSEDFEMLGVVEPCDKIPEIIEID